MKIVHSCGRFISFLLLTVLLGIQCISCGLVELRTTNEDPLANTDKDTETQSPTTERTSEIKETTGPVDTEPSKITTPEPTVKRLKFIAAGDNILHESVYNDAQKRAENGTAYDFLPMYDGIRDYVANADIAFINQETPMAGSSYGYHGYPNFNSPQEGAQALVDLGFDIVNIATNHMLDMKTSGLRDSILFWKTMPVLLLGGYENQQDYDAVRIYEADGVKIAMLSYTYGTNGMTLDAGSSLIVPLFDEETIKRQMSIAKQKGDLVFVSVHWGTENSYTIDSMQSKYAQLFAGLGADVVIGHHPHVVQPVKWLESTEANGGRTLVIYSLGNLISTMLYGYNMLGGIAEFEIVIESGQKPYIDSPVFVPTVTHYSMERDGLQVYFLEDYTDGLASQHGCTKYTSNFSVSYLTQLLKDNISAEFLPAFLSAAQSGT